MNEVDIHDGFDKVFAEPKQTLAYLDNLLTSRFIFFTDCQAIVNACLYLKDTHPEAIKPNLQYIKHLQTRFDAEMREKYGLAEWSYGFNPFDDLNKLITLFNNIRELDEICLHKVRQALAAIDRLPQLFITAFTLDANGFNIGSLEDDLKKTAAELETGDYSMYFTKPGEKARYYLEDENPQAAAGLRKLYIMILYYPRQVEKLENFLHSHSQGLKHLDPIELANQAAAAGVKKASKNIFRTLIKIIHDYLCGPDIFKKKADNLLKPGPPRTRDIKCRQCEMMWELSQDPKRKFKNAHALANTVILHTKRNWNTDAYKDENLFLYTQNQPQRNTKNQLVTSFKSWCTANNKDYPFETE